MYVEMIYGLYTFEYSGGLCVHSALYSAAIRLRSDSDKCSEKASDESNRLTDRTRPGCLLRTVALLYSKPHNLNSKGYHHNLCLAIASNVIPVDQVQWASVCFPSLWQNHPANCTHCNYPLSVWNANTSWCFLFNRNRFWKCSMFASWLITATNIRVKGAMRREELKSELCIGCNNPSGPTVRYFSLKRLIVYFTHTKNIHLYIGTSVSSVRRSKRMYNLSLFLATRHHDESIAR